MENKALAGGRGLEGTPQEAVPVKCQSLLRLEQGLILAPTELSAKED